VQPRIRLSPVSLVLLTALGLACRGGDGAPGEAAVIPARAGDVWELENPADRASAPAAMTAFVNGVHVVVVDGDDIYAGTGKLAAGKAEAGARVLPIAADTARLVAEGEALTLRFASGTTARLRRRPEARR